MPHAKALGICQALQRAGVAKDKPCLRGETDATDRRQIVNQIYGIAARDDEIRCEIRTTPLILAKASISRRRGREQAMQQDLEENTAKAA